MTTAQINAARSACRHISNREERREAVREMLREMSDRQCRDGLRRYNPGRQFRAA